MKKALLITMGLLLLLCGLYRLELKGETRSGPDEATIQKAVATLHDVYEEQESYMLGVQLKPSEFDQISIECRFLTTRPEYVAPEGFTHQRGWRFVANAAGHEEGAFLRGNEILEQDSSEKKGILSFTESYSPALYRFLNQEQVEALLNLVLRDSRSEVLLAPKVTFFNGQAARVQDTNRSPWPRTNGASNFHVEFVDEGMKLNITAEHLGDNVIRLTACDIYSTKRREAERFQLYPGRDCMQGDKEGDNEVYDIYIPKIETTHVKIPVTLPKDHSLLLAIPGLLEDKESMLCVMIKGNILPNEEDEEMLREAIKSSSANVYESERKLPEPGEYQKKVYDEWERFWFADSPQSGAPQ